MLNTSTYTKLKMGRNYPRQASVRLKAGHKTGRTYVKYIDLYKS